MVLSNKNNCHTNDNEIYLTNPLCKGTTNTLAELVQICTKDYNFNMSRLSRFTAWLISSPVGRLIARPWLDSSALYLLKHWYFPLSRLWAAARAAEGDVDKFIAAVPLEAPNSSERKTIASALRQFERARLKAFSMEQLWHQYFFGTKPVAAERLPIVEEMRLDFRTDYNMARKKFVALRRLVKTSVSMNPPTPAEVAEQFGDNGERLPAYFALPEEFPEIEVSRSIPTSNGKDYWLRFPSPSQQMNDLVYARVHEPAGVENPPTLIFGHGMSVEFDHYHQLLDEITQLTRLGIRVIRPEAPWHGRRVLPGHYGGEQFLSRLPISIFDFVAAQHKEWSTIIKWCRDDSTGPVAIGGSSLGAQTAKAITMSATSWPAYLQPDALLAITHSQQMFETAFDGVLSDIWNLGDAMRAAGWHQDTEKSWLQRVDPQRPACIKGENIVTVCGSKDKVTPIATALKQMDAWNVPAENRFCYPRGHFSIPLGMIYDNEPLLRFAAVIRKIEQQKSDSSHVAKHA